MPTSKYVRDCGMYGEIKLFAGTASTRLASKIAQYLNLDLGGRDVTRFANGNLFVRLHKSVRGQDGLRIRRGDGTLLRSPEARTGRDVDHP